MIVPMKKVSVVTLKSLEHETLAELGELGVLHVFTDRVEADRAEHLRSQLSAVDHALTVIPEGESAERSRRSGDEAVDEALTIAERCQHLTDEESQLVDERERLVRETERLAPWGGVDPARIATLRTGGVQVGLYEVTADAAGELIERLPNVIEVSRSKTLVRVAGIAVGEETLPDDVAPIALPDRSTAEIAARRDEVDVRIADIAAELRSLASRRPTILAAREQLGRDIEFATVRASMDSDKELSWITGFAPHDIVDDVRSTAKTNGWGVVVRDPQDEEQVPTKTRNPKPIGIIKPVFDLLGTVPGYREMDISFFFLAFFVVFFAMIIGDGGYGLILLGGTLFSAIRGTGRGKPIGTGTVLMLVLSSATVVWGAITGNWFGYAPFNDLPFLRDVVIPSISIDNDASAQLIQYVCFVIGTIHLSIAHIWNFLREVRRKPRIAAIAQLGWLSMVLGLYYLVLQLVLDPSLYPMPDYALYMIAGGLAAVFLFGSQEEGSGFFAGILRGLGGFITTALDGISAFSDIISYIRLYAVGLASLAIAEAFNGMAQGIAAGMDGAVGAIAAALVLFLGHSLNLAMGALSVVVHGVRLNMLEFSGHLGMEWTGVEYAPFRTR